MTVELTHIPGIEVGHWTDRQAGTGCTVALCPHGAVAGVDIRGTAPGTRETALLDPVCMVEQVHAIVLSGGSAYGLAAADGVMRWLAERGHGFRVGAAVVPIVPAAILFDLALGRSDGFPDREAGYAACQAAHGGPVAVGNIGAGTGAAAGKGLGMDQATKSGIGKAGISRGALKVAAMVAANPFGHVIDPVGGQIVAGPRLPDGSFADSVALLVDGAGHIGANTTLAIVATNARLTKAAAAKVAQMAHDGFARTIRPVHTHFDGDAIFTLSAGDIEADVSLVGALAADVVAEAVLSAVCTASAAYGLPGRAP